MDPVNFLLFIQLQGQAYVLVSPDALVCAYFHITAGVTGKGGTWQTKPPDAESAIGARIPKVWANARTCPVHAVLGCFA
jgi:hypothetical protein